MQDHAPLPSITLTMPGINYTPAQRAGIALAGLSRPYRSVASEFSCSISTVSRLIHRHVTAGNRYSPPRPGRPSRTTPSTRARICRLILRNRRLSPSQLLPLLRAAGLPLSLSPCAVSCANVGLPGAQLASNPFHLLKLGPSASPTPLNTAQRVLITGKAQYLLMKLLCASMGLSRPL